MHMKVFRSIALRPAVAVAVAAVVSGALIVETRAQHPAKKTAGSPRQIQIDLDSAIALALPKPTTPLTPKPFATRDLKKGWLIEIPGNRPIATPAYWQGMLFVGGGYGSYEFYAFDAKTGKLIWKVKTKDDGPTAAVVEDGLVAFNTESCTVMVLDAKTGKLVW
jgi:outer membrane protein assembly factor BamB